MRTTLAQRSVSAAGLAVAVALLAGCATSAGSAAAPTSVNGQTGLAYVLAEAPAVDPKDCGSTIMIDWSPSDARPTVEEAITYLYNEWEPTRELLAQGSTGPGFASRIQVLEWLTAEINAGRFTSDSVPLESPRELTVANPAGDRIATLTFDEFPDGGYAIGMLAEALTPCGEEVITGVDESPASED